MGKAARRIRAEEVDTEVYEINLAPMLDMIMSLIPVLLVSAVFAQITIIEAPLPQIVQEAIEESKKNKEDLAQVSVNIGETNVEVVVAKGKNKNSRTIASTAEGYNLSEIHQHFIQVKAQNPQVFKISVIPAEAVTHQKVIEILDEARNTRKGEVRFKVKGKDGVSEAETDLMFPEVEFTSVGGGNV